MLPQPRDDAAKVDLVRGYSDGEVDYLICRVLQPYVAGFEECSRCMHCGSLVPVDEWVIAYDALKQRGRFLCRSWVELNVAETCRYAAGGGFQSSRIANAWHAAAGYCQYLLM